MVATWEREHLQLWLTPLLPPAGQDRESTQLLRRGVTVTTVTTSTFHVISGGDGEQQSTQSSTDQTHTHTPDLPSEVYAAHLGKVSTREHQSFTATAKRC